MYKIVRKIADKLGLEVNSKNLKQYDEFIDIYNECRPYTMTSIERMYALYKAVEYIAVNNIPGDMYECGVWRGGSAMLIVKTLQKFNSLDRNIYLFDTYEGMTEPGDIDTDKSGKAAAEYLKKLRKNDPNYAWCFADLADVKNNMEGTGYPKDKFHYVQGKVEDTLPSFMVQNDIALLRLDTDWYDSTKMEMVYLYPRVTVGGVLILDDYGYWEGSKIAVDEYLAENNVKLLLNRIDVAGRIAVKTSM